MCSSDLAGEGGKDWLHFSSNLDTLICEIGYDFLFAKGHSLGHDVGSAGQSLGKSLGDSKSPTYGPSSCKLSKM